MELLRVRRLRCLRQFFSYVLLLTNQSTTFRGVLGGSKEASVSRVLRVGGLDGYCKSAGILGGVGVSIGGKRIIMVVNPSKYKGDALLHYLGKLRRVRRKRILLSSRIMGPGGGGLDGGQRGVKVMFRDCSLFPCLAVLRGIALTPVGMGGEGHERMRGRTLRLLRHIKLHSGGSSCPERLSNKRGREITVMHTLVVRPRMLLLSRVATTLSPRVIERMLSIILSLTGRKEAVIVIARRVRFTGTMTSHIAFLRNKGVMRRKSPGGLFRGPRASHLREFLRAFACRGTIG